jgi:hypothetical protein
MEAMISSDRPQHKQRSCCRLEGTGAGRERQWAALQAPHPHAADDEEGHDQQQGEEDVCLHG